MATLELLQGLSEPVSPPLEGADLDFSGLNSASLANRGRARATRSAARLWMVLDGLTILWAVLLATFYALHAGSIDSVRQFWTGMLLQGRSMSILLAILCGFTASLILISQQLHLYTPTRITSFLNEQRLSVQACVTAGLLLTGSLYLMHAEDIPRRLVLATLVLVTVALSLRRLIYRLLLYHNYDLGNGTRNVLIVGSGPEAQALRTHMESIRHLGYTFKGFVEISSFGGAELCASRSDPLTDLFHQARRQFVDEIFFTTPCDRKMIPGVLAQARKHGIDLRAVPEMYDGLAWNSAIEYIGQFPTIPLHCGGAPEYGTTLKRGTDVVFSLLALILFFPLMVAVAVAIRLDSPGPVLYFSERLGKKGRHFRCIKFRTMVGDAEKRRADILHMNERDGVLFKVSNDPRITRLGRFLRKYSLDELPQFYNVLLGDMSVVGPRPPIASEVREYNLSHLRRLDVTPGITGLWQVQGRQDPSFDSYVSLDLTYIENWSLWLDFKIIVRTVGVVLAGTGT